MAYRNGAPVRLEELGHVVDSVENDKTASWYYDAKGLRRGIMLADSAPARHQHGGSGGLHQAAAAQLSRADAALGQSGHALRPLGFHPRLGGRREVHACS